MRDAKPAAIYLKDYRPPAYLVTHTDLHFELWEDHALVTSRLQLRRNAGVGAATPLQLDGVGLELLGLRLDGQAVGAGQTVRWSDVDIDLDAPAAAFRREMERAEFGTVT